MLGKISFPYTKIMFFPETYSTLQLTPMVSQHSEIKNVGNLHRHFGPWADLQINGLLLCKVVYQTENTRVVLDIVNRHLQIPNACYVVTCSLFSNLFHHSVDVDVA